MNAIAPPFAGGTPVLSLPRRHSLFRGFGPAQIARISQSFQHQTHARGETLRRHGPGAPHVGILLDGVLREDVVDASGQTRLIGLTVAQEMLSPTGPRTGRTRLTALDDALVLGCDAKEFAALTAEFPRLQMNLLDIVQDQIAEARRCQVMLGRKTATQRVASLLSSLWVRQRRPDVLSLRLTRQEIGQMLGLTFETVSRQIKALEQTGLIALPQPSVVAIRDNTGLLMATGDLMPGARAA